MEARLAHHKATRNEAGNHFLRADLAARHRLGEPEDAEARREREIAAMVAHAHWAGRRMAMWAVGAMRMGLMWGGQPELSQLLAASANMWLTHRWDNFQVHELLRPLANNEMVRQLRKRGWRL